MAGDTLVCVATDLEGALLRRFAIGTGGKVAVIRTGVGPVNAAHAVTLEITRARPGAIVVCGIAGAYPGSGLAVGQVASAASESYGDLGATSPTGFLDMAALGFPLVAGPPPIYNTFLMQLFPTTTRVPFVTMSTCTGVAALAHAIESRTGGAVENMEGAAVAHVGHLHGIPVGEVRGISNIVTDRDPRAWRIEEAATAAQEALISWLEHR
ncbi:MAG: futalosine hydrolase [Gemmatimonadales bacterium]